ncbi:hypothetical protein [Niallia sp. 03133]|uniref:hypothetical protein n=1 Tax=Niallia sp. 03133 TaxID=3458060 RepID=UPI004044EEF6
MRLGEDDILYIINKITPKINKCLNQTNYANRDDLEQDLKEIVIKTLKREKINRDNIPGLFEYLE